MQSLLEPDIEKRIDDVMNLIREASRSNSFCSTSFVRSEKEFFLTDDSVKEESNLPSGRSDCSCEDDIGSVSEVDLLPKVEYPVLPIIKEDPPPPAPPPPPPAEVLNLFLLPDNVMLNVFRYLDDKIIRSKIHLVCKKWKTICKDSSIYNRLKFTDKDSELINVCKSLQNAHQLQELKLHKVRDICTVIRQLCRSNPTIKLLHVKYCIADQNIEKVPEAVFVNLILCCKALEHLNLKGTPFKAKKFYQQLPCSEKLKSFGFGANPFLRSTDILTVAYNCRTLNEFNMSRRPHTLTLTDQDIAFIFSKTNMASRITSLKFDAIGLTPLQFQDILNCRKLEQLTLNNAVSIPGHVFQKITRKMPRLRKMKIRQGYEIKPFDFIEVFKFNNLTKLTHLDFYGCWRLNNNALSAIVGCTFPNLEHFSISSCSEVNSVQEIFKCTQLRFLNVSYIGKVDKESVKLLGLSLPLLKVFVVDGNDDYPKILSEMKLEKRRGLKLLQAMSQYNPKKLIEI